MGGGRCPSVADAGPVSRSGIDRMIPIGIDLGTTNIVAAWVDAAGDPRVLYGEDGNALLPATVYFESANVVAVGRDPFKGTPLNVDNLAIQTKRWLGRPRLFPFNGRDYSAVELASLMLRKVIARAEERLGDRVGPITLAIPAHFDVAQRAALQQVADLAGAPLHSIVSEPVAAAIAYGNERDTGLVGALADGVPTLVIDLGGGTLDISLVVATPDVIDVPVVAGDAHLGGMDFDRVVYYRLCHHLLDETGIDPVEFPELRFKLLSLSRWAKETLTFNDSVTLRVPAAWMEDREARPLELPVGEANALWDGLLERAEGVLLRVLEEARARGLEVGRLVFAGGGSLVPVFRERMLAHLTGLTPAQDPLMGPDEAVAVGAALYARMKLPQKASPPIHFPALHERLPYELGVADDVGHLVVIVPRGTPLPGSGEHVFTTVEDNQAQVIFRIVRQDADGQVTLLGELRLDGIPPAPRGEPDLRVQFSVDAEGALSVAAWEGDRQPVKLHVAFTGDLSALRPARRGRQLTVL
jgi:molecular chaperone DnaK